MTIDQIKKLIEKSQTDRERLEAEAEAAEAEAAEAGRAAEGAAAAGDVDGYKQHKARHDDAATLAHVRRAQIAHAAGAVTKADIVEAWSDFAGDYNKRLSKMLKEYQSMREKLLSAFWNEILLQREALTERAKLAALIGMNENDLKMDFIPTDDRSAPGRWQVNDVDAQFYAAFVADDPMERVNSSKLSTINDVLRLHRA